MFSMKTSSGLINNQERSEMTTNMRELDAFMSAVDDELNTPTPPDPSWWKPENNGDTRGGYFRGVDRSGKYPVARFEDNTGEWSTSLTTVLEGALDSQNAQNGDFVAIRYHGMKQGFGGGKPYKLFRVIVRKQQ